MLRINSVSGRAELDRARRIIALSVIQIPSWRMGAVVSIKTIDKIVGCDIHATLETITAQTVPLIALFSSDYTDPFVIQLVRASPRNTTSNYQIYYIVSHRPAGVIVFCGQFRETRFAIMT